MYFDRYPKKQQIVSEISIKCNQAHLGMLLINQITEFMKFQYLQNESRDKIDFFICIYPKKQPSDSNIHIENAQIILKVYTSYFQNEEFALYVSKIKEGMK